MKLTILDLDNGYVLFTEWGDAKYNDRVVVEQHADESEAATTQRLLWEVIECLGLYGSRYDQERVYVEVRPGDKYLDAHGLLEDE